MSNRYKTKLDLLRERISKDHDLKSTSKKITYTALVTYAITLSGATIQQANTFLFEIKFTNPNGLSLLLLMALIYLLIKYNGLAVDYFKDINDLDELRFHSNPFIVDGNNPNNIYKGVVGDIVEDNSGATDAKLRWKFPLNMYVDVTFEVDRYGESNTIEVNLNKGSHKKNLKTKLIIVKCIAINKAANYINHPDHLNLMGPYYLGGLAITLVITNLFFPSALSTLLSKLT